MLVRTAPTKGDREQVDEDASVIAIKEEFDDVIVSELPKHSKYNGGITHRIDLIPGMSPTHSRPYRMSEEDNCWK